jgi:hypothetical protein
MPFAAYDRVTGKIRCTNSRPGNHDPDSEDQIEVDGYHYTHIVSGVPVVIESAPSVEQLLYDIRAKRNALLAEIDLVYCNAERWSAMTPEQQQAWKIYKQALRDFPEICDPANPVWPAEPS